MRLARLVFFCYYLNVKPRFRQDLYPDSGRGYVHACPQCGAALDLCELRDGDQAYWCHRCERGHRAGDPPLEYLRPLPSSA
ncbi:hypothetical protein DES52_12740 [Deinococcus yavapaiensis KR-236]|uniref:Uncharacterized protein n=1 Tax=Deinococcus yavapaiensis KR-236 TaxID=694435 RepID=A0A318S3E2_9DEIO|nr:hypothetical protein DES52_12740 [Deinococcus yavapaiensis KR-236]